MKKKIFSIKEIIIEKETHVFTIEIDFSHSVLKGHFPKNPIIPGVMTNDIISNLISKIKEEKYILVSAKNIKFIKPIQPKKNNIYTVKIAEKIKSIQDKISVIASISQENDFYYKLNAEFKKIK